MDRSSTTNKKSSMLAGSRRHLEGGHEKYILDTIQNHPAQVYIFPISSCHSEDALKWTVHAFHIQIAKPVVDF